MSRARSSRLMMAIHTSEQDFQRALRFSAGRVFQRFTDFLTGRSRSQKPPESPLSWVRVMRSDFAASANRAEGTARRINCEGNPILFEQRRARPAPIK